MGLLTGRQLWAFAASCWRLGGWHGARRGLRPLGVTAPNWCGRCPG